MHLKTIGATPAYCPRAHVARFAACALAVPLALACLGTNCPLLGGTDSSTFFSVKNCPNSDVSLGTQVILRVDRAVTVHAVGAAASEPLQLPSGEFEITITPGSVGSVLVVLIESDESGATVAEGRCNFNVVAVGAGDDGSGGSDPCDTGPVVQPLTAEFNAEEQSTTYNEEADELDGDDLTYDWATPSCGTVSFLFDDPDDGVPTDFTEMTWHHPHPPCDKTTDHSSETITVEVSDGCWQVTCAYQGATNGPGPSCALPQRVSP